MSSTFREFNSRTNTLARGLLNAGLTPGGRVAVLNHNSVELFEVYFGTMKAGGIPVPINVRLAPPEVAEILQDAAPSLLLVHKNYLPKIPPKGPGQTWNQVYTIGGSGTLPDYESLIGNYPTSRVEPVADDDDPAILSDTSGTTGKPKGVMLTHRNLLADVWSSCVTRRLAPDDVATRQATLMIPPNTEASLVMPDGAVQPIITMNVRATEYTVGPDGPKAMPAELPSQVAYTYCVEMTADEALEAGATDVRFNHPLYIYLEDFIGFPVGSAVPSGYYDWKKGQWIPSENGRVIKVLSIAGGIAELDTNGDGSADGPTTLGALNITDAERVKLAGLYGPGQNLWRVPITHFTPWDYHHRPHPMVAIRQRQAGQPPAVIVMPGRRNSASTSQHLACQTLSAIAVVAVARELVGLLLAVLQDALRPPPTSPNPPMLHDRVRLGLEGRAYALVVCGLGSPPGPAPATGARAGPRSPERGGG